MHKLGDYELHAVSDGSFKLDGGAMFGIVPKPVWEKVMPADGRQLIANEPGYRALLMTLDQFVARIPKLPAR